MIAIALNPNETGTLLYWSREHTKTCSKSEFTLTQTGSSGIGPTTQIVCICGQHVDLTDYESW